MPLIPLTIPPGVYKNGTDLQASGRWADSDLVRWHDDSLKPIGGWRNRLDRGWSHPIRGLIGWKSNSGSRYLACGTYANLFAILPNNSTYDITPTGFTAGRIDASGMTGYGSGFYSNSTYGTPPINTSTTLLDATSWSLSPWGENLIANSPDDGKVYEWALNTGSAAAVLSNAPTGVVSIIVSDERFLFAFKNREVYWSDQENNNVWTALATNQAGSIGLETQGAIKTAEKIRGGILIITDQDAHTCTYIGQPFVHSIQRVGDGCGIFSSQASTTIPQGVVWMGGSGFHLYSGGRVKELQCDVTDHVFDEMSMTQKSKVACVANSKFDEVIWYYPSSESSENNRYVSWNFKSNTWAIGNLGRTSGIDAGVFEKPIYATTEYHTQNVARGRFTMVVPTDANTVGGDSANNNVNVWDVGNQIYQEPTIIGSSGNTVASGTTVVTNALDNSQQSQAIIGYLSKITSGTVYESLTFPSEQIICEAFNVNASSSQPPFKVTLTGLDENSQSITEEIRFGDDGSTYSGTEYSYTKTTNFFTKVTNVRVERTDSGTGQWTYQNLIALAVYDDQEYSNGASEGVIKNVYNGITQSGSYPSNIIDVEISEQWGNGKKIAPFIRDAWIRVWRPKQPALSEYGGGFTNFNPFTPLPTHVARAQFLLTPQEYMLVEHEVGEERDSLVPFAESGPIQIGNGDNVMAVNQVIPDEKTQGQVNVDFKTRFYPNGDETTHGTYALANPTSVRFQGREVRMKVKNVSGDWRVGSFRLNAVPGGKR